MRDLKPLALPKLAATRKSSRSSLDMPSESASSLCSSGDSGFFSSSECSTPPTPSLHTRGHLRHPSSTSSLSSSPPIHEQTDPPNSSGKLPKLTEVEREDEIITQPCRSSNDDPWCFNEACGLEHDYFSSSAWESQSAKRRRSAESPAHSITNKLERRFPSLSRKVRDHRRSSTLGRPSRSTTPSRVPSTRSSSITSSIHQIQGLDVPEQFPYALTPAHTSKEHINEASSPSPLDIDKANALDIDATEVEAERNATTPLLPPMLVKSRLEDLPAQSPLQSPTIADASQSLVATPIDTPPARAYPTPPLSSKTSVASFNASRPGHLVPSSDIPPIMLADPNDKWANVLGHANFTIAPEPYVPDVCDAVSMRRLFADWEQARCNYAKHQVRTAEHYGVTSRAYHLTEQKWAEIDALWKKNHDLAISRITITGVETEPNSPVEPAPLSKMPSLNDPKSEGKFPKLGDEDIVGPMVQIASQMPRTPSRKRALFKFFSDMKFPGLLLGRSAAGVRGP